MANVPASEGGSATTPPGRGLRVLELAAGLLGPGIGALGLVLLAVQVFAPSSAEGLTQGPGWGRVAAHLGAAVLIEAGRAVRPRLGLGARVAVAEAGVLAGVAVLVWAWWL